MNPPERRFATSLCLQTQRNPEISSPHLTNIKNHKLPSSPQVINVLQSFSKHKVFFLQATKFDREMNL
jgi:hypothetical protein